MTSAARGLAPLLTPHGHLLASLDADAPPLPAGLEDRLAAAPAKVTALAVRTSATKAGKHPPGQHRGVSQKTPREPAPVSAL